MSSSRDDWHIRDMEYESNNRTLTDLTPFEKELADILYHERSGRVPKYDCQVYAKTLAKKLIPLALNDVVEVKNLDKNLDKTSRFDGAKHESGQGTNVKLKRQ